MPSKYEEIIYQMLRDEPVTPNEIAKALKITHKTAQKVLMHLALSKDDVRYKNSGRIYMFWRAQGQQK